MRSQHFHHLYENLFAMTEVPLNGLLLWRSLLHAKVQVAQFDSLNECHSWHQESSLELQTNVGRQ